MDDIQNLIERKFSKQSGNINKSKFCFLKFEVTHFPAFVGTSNVILSVLLVRLFHLYNAGIIYTFSRKETEDVTLELQSRGIKAGCYHADLSARERSRVHKAWLDNAIHVGFS